MRLVAIVLAAGEGRRMGGPKALLRIGESTFLAHTAALLDRPGVDSVLAVVGSGSARVRAESGLPAEFPVVVNPRPEDGMLGSILCGLEHAERAGADAVLVHPVDHPLVAPGTVDRVVAAIRDGAVIAVPSHDGRRGHPAGFARAAWPALRSASAGEGARAVLSGHPEWVVHVPGGAECRAGINVPADYERLIKERERP